VTLWLTAAFSADMTRASSEHLQANLTWFAGQPILQTAPGPFRIDFDYSHLDGPDVLVSDEQALVIGAVEDVVLSCEHRVGRLRTDDQELMARWSGASTTSNTWPPITWPARPVAWRRIPPVGRQSSPCSPV
jgi:hypothetical protein